MTIDSITLNNFRNHPYLSYEFPDGITIIEGDNAVGKTNVAEAIQYLSIARSFRTVNDEELISKGKDKAEIEAVVSEGRIRRRIHILLSREGKCISINGKNISKISELSRCVNVILFEPRDVVLFRGSPRERRNFLDISLSKKSPPYLDYITRYEKVLRQRNDVLKSNNPDKNLLDAMTEMLVKLSGPIVSYRQMYVKDINDILYKIARALTGAREKIEVIYKPFVGYDDNFEKNAAQAFKRAEDNDLRHRVTSIGVHREDFSVELDGRDIGAFGSQGENRVAALALKLSPYFLIEDKDKRPVVVLDDVMSELDTEHCRRLTQFLSKFGQVFITATKLDIENSHHCLIKKKQKEIS